MKKRPALAFGLATYGLLLLLSHGWQVYAPPSNPLDRLTAHAAATGAPHSDFVLVSARASNGRPVAAAPGVRIAYEEWPGTSEVPIVALHGSPGRSRTFGYFASALTGFGQRLVAPDMPGYGASTHAIPNYGFVAQAHYLRDLLDGLRIERAVFVCYSLSSGWLLELSRIAPERIAGAVFVSGIGVQEGEGSGSYAFEHFKYAIGYVLAVWLPELLPHFGMLGSHSYRNTFIRSFYDADQRPLRAALTNFPAPLLILHGADDALVPAWVAEEHARIVSGSELVIFDDDHYMIFKPDRARDLARLTTDFLNRRVRSNEVARLPVRESLSHLNRNVLPVELDLDPALGLLGRLGVIVLSTFVSEDLTCISAGFLIREHRLDLFTGVFACFVGIFLGDLGLYLLGVALRRGLLVLPRLGGLFEGQRMQSLARRFDREGWKLIVASRFLPGTRLPVYVGAGILGGQASRLALFALLAGLIWTPLLVLLAAFLGPLVLAPFEFLLGQGWLAVALAILLLFYVFRTMALLLTGRGRLIVLGRLARWRHAEFWPPWIFYAPLAPLVVWLTVRYRGFGTLSAANPGIRDGGFINESKADILDCLPSAWVCKYVTVEPEANLKERRRKARARMAGAGLDFPVILKPDAAQRGVGLKLAREPAQLDRYVAEHPLRFLIQAYHAGPREAGLFYVRHPDQSHGRLFSITDKQFPVLTGDGQSTVAELILGHKRYRMQYSTFAKRHVERLDRILARGEILPLTLAGNHYQGTMFLDGKALWSEALERQVDRIAQAFPGFYFGRFDVRFEDAAELRQGRGFQIVELNGATSESTNVYDPRMRVAEVYRILYRQWILLFQIGDANRKRGAKVTSVFSLVGDIGRYLLGRTRSIISD
ncbi:MAG: alpha/beta fold hydrolase [Spirochaetales bacterium]|nr:alpha/beta fold hydrolase [Leptospiraceae bacterium]MCP5482343.1 alpha/beta fold hydrolase [Spirochaetales bacterium]